MQNIIDSHDQEINTIDSMIMSKLKELVLKGHLKASNKSQELKAHALSSQNNVLT